jgi:hypothetical protein
MSSLASIHSAAPQPGITLAGPVGKLNQPDGSEQIIDFYPFHHQN